MPSKNHHQTHSPTVQSLNIFLSNTNIKILFSSDNQLPILIDPPIMKLKVIAFQNHTCQIN